MQSSEINELGRSLSCPLTILLTLQTSNRLQMSSVVLSCRPCFTRMTEFTSQVLVVMMASLGYLLDTLQPIATAVAEKWREEQRRTTNSSSGGGAEYPPNSSSKGGADNANPFLGRSILHDQWGSGGGLGEGLGRTTNDSYNTQGITGFGAWGSAGGVGPSAQQGFAEPSNITIIENTQGSRPYQASANGIGPTKDGQNQSWGAGWGSNAAEQQNRQDMLRQQSKPSGYEAVVQRQRHVQGEEMFSSMLEAAAQSLRTGIAAVNKWLAVRVVWWEQRAGWCELLYRYEDMDDKLQLLL